MIHRNALRCLATALLAIANAWAAAPAAAQSIPKGKDIHIHMAGSRTKPEGSNPYRIDKVLPNNKGICRAKGNELEDCLADVAWLLKGPGLPTGWYVEVRQKEAATKKCFAAAPFALRNDDPVPSGSVDEKVCGQFDVWPYDVVLLDAEGKEKGRLDPLIVINY